MQFDMHNMHNMYIKSTCKICKIICKIIYIICDLVCIICRIWNLIRYAKNMQNNMQQYAGFADIILLLMYFDRSMQNMQNNMQNSIIIWSHPNIEVQTFDMEVILRYCNLRYRIHLRYWRFDLRYRSAKWPSISKVSDIEVYKLRYRNSISEVTDIEVIKLRYRCSFSVYFDIEVYNIEYDIGYYTRCCMQNPMEFTAEQQPSLHGPPCAYAAESQPLVLWIPACSFCAFPQLAQPCSTVNWGGKVLP